MPLPPRYLFKYSPELISAQIMFEAVYCYFPITFRPPPGDPNAISAQDLKDRLRECLAASKYLAPHVFPSILEKLDSHSANVKV